MKEVTSNQSKSYNSSSKAYLPSKANIVFVLMNLQNEESMSRAKLINIIAGSLSDQHPGRSARILVKRAAMASLFKKYQQVDFNTWMNSAMAV